MLRQSSLVDEVGWRRIVDEGPYFHRVVHTRGVVSSPNAMREVVYRAFSAATTRLGGSDLDLPSLRAFHNSSLDYRASENLMCGAFQCAKVDAGDTPLHDWIEKKTKVAGVCVVLNALESWDRRASELLYTDFVAPLAAAGVPLPRGVDWYCFVASSGGTPFGLHTDAEPSFVINLGPANKIARVWPENALPYLPHGRPRTFNVEPLLKQAVSYELAPGDFLLVPAGRYHLFENHGPSLLLGLTVYPDDPSGAILDLLRNQLNAPVTSHSVSEALECARDWLCHGDVESAIQARSMRRISAGYGSTPRFAAREHDYGPPYVVTQLPIIVEGSHVYAMGAVLNVELGKIGPYLTPGAVLTRETVNRLTDTPLRKSTIDALIHVGALRSERDY